MHLTLDRRALAYRDVLRATLRRLCSNYIRNVQGGKRRLPEQVTAELLFEIHCQYLELLRYSQMVVADHALLQEDEQWRAICLREALEAMAKVDGIAKVVARASVLRTKAQVSHPEYAPVEFEVAGETLRV